MEEHDKHGVGEYNAHENGKKTKQNATRYIYQFSHDFCYSFTSTS